MTDEDTAATRIRSPASAWVMMAASGVTALAVAGLPSALPHREFLLGFLSRPGWLLAIGSALVLEALWVRTCGVDLLPEHALVRGLGRRAVPWRDVRAVVRRRRLGAWVVQLVLENGRPVTLRAPASLFEGKRQVAAYERDFHRIGQWWLDHRGPSWREVTDTA